jgi:hypothetical protein
MRPDNEYVVLDIERCTFYRQEAPMIKMQASRLFTVAAGSALCLTLVLGFLATPLPAEDEELPLSFNAIAQNLSNVGPRGQSRLQINVSRWTTGEERAALMEALKSQGPGARTLASALFEQEIVGSFREIQSLRENLRYSRRTSVEGGQRIVLATDRPLAFAEVRRSARTMDYNVTLIVLDLDAEGNGEGQILAGAELSWDDAKDQMVIEHFASEPIRLTRVRLQ